jgi:outer membrane lipoprotein carrier protein
MTMPLRTTAALLSLALAACGGRESAPVPAADGAPAAEVPGALPPLAAAGDGAAGGGVVASDTAAAAVPGGGGSGAADPPVAGAPARGAEATGDRAAEILARAERASLGIRSLEADFTQTLTIPLLNRTERSAGRLVQRRPDRFLMRFSDPQGDIIVADGRHFWLYYPSSDVRQVIRTSIADGGEAVDLHRQFLSNPHERFDASVTGEERVGGRATDVLALAPRGPSPYRSLRIWVDRQDHMVRRFEMTEDNGSVRRVELSNLRTNHAVPDALFTFTPPEGAQVFDQ